MVSIFTNVLRRSSKRKEAKRFIKFSMVGALGALIDFGILNFLIFSVGWTSDLGKVMANVISTSLAIVSNFTWNRLWTFPESRSRKKRSQLPKFTIVNLIGLAINTLIFYISDNFIYAPLFHLNIFYNDVGVFIFEPLSPETLAIQLAKATAIAIVLFWNFGANRLWTYRGL